jgi:sugar-specific transcriptional regulator TrmB
MELRDMLRFNGFTQVESDVYIKLLEVRSARVGDLSELTRITRTQLYPLLENMVGKGYVKQVGTKPISFEALPPRDLIRLLKERFRKQTYSLSDLESKLVGVSPSTKLSADPYRVYLLKGKENILRRLRELWESTEGEVVSTVSFERELVSGSKVLSDIVKEKIRKGVRHTIYLSAKPENLQKISERTDLTDRTVLGGIVKEQPFDVSVFDKRSIIIAFYNLVKKEYDTAFYFENPDLAESFMKKSVAPIESYPAEGEVRMSSIGGERAFVMPPVLDILPKDHQYNLGYGVGFYGIKAFKNTGQTLNSLALILVTQISTNGWGKARLLKVSDKDAIISIENTVVPPAFIKGDMVGFLEVMGDYSVSEKSLDSKSKRYEFRIAKK